MAGRFHWRGFLVNRLSRLWIVLLPALALTAVCDWTGGRLFADADIYRMPSSYAGVPPVPTDTFAVLLGNIAFLQSLRMPVFGYNNPLWSLSYEFWYYIAFPGFLISVRRSASWRVRLGSFAAMASAMLIGGTAALTLFPAWLLGAAAGYRFVILDGARRRHPVLAGVGLPLVLAAALLASMIVARLGCPRFLAALVIGGVAAALFLSVARDGGGAGVGSKLLTWTSRASHCTYSLYLTHMPLIVLAVAAVGPSRPARWPLLSWWGLWLIPITLALYGVGSAVAFFTERRTDAVRRRVLSLLDAHGITSKRDKPLHLSQDGHPGR